MFYEFNVIDAVLDPAIEEIANLTGKKSEDEEKISKCTIDLSTVVGYMKAWVVYRTLGETEITRAETNSGFDHLLIPYEDFDKIMKSNFPEKFLKPINEIENAISA